MPNAPFFFSPNQRFARLVILERTDQHSRTRVILWRCRCDCGNEFLARADRLKHGKTRSCGCVWRAVRRATLIARNTRHGDDGSKLYRVWEMLKERTGKPNSKDYKNFGARGVTLCEEWRVYTVFRSWAMAHGYANDLSIQLIDRAGNFAPANCRWARSYNFRTPKQRRSEKMRAIACAGGDRKELEIGTAATMEAAMTG